MQFRHQKASIARCPPLDICTPTREMHALLFLFLPRLQSEQAVAPSKEAQLRREIPIVKSSRHVLLLCKPSKCCLWCDRDFNNCHDLYFLDSIRRTNIFGISAQLSLVFRLLERALPRVASRQYMLHSRKSTSVRDQF
jgi:hypothetical protein